MFAQPLSGKTHSAKDYLYIIGSVALGLFLLPTLLFSAAQEFAPQATIGLQLLVGALWLSLFHLATKGNFAFSRPDWLRLIAMSLLGITVYRVLSRYALTIAVSHSLSNLAVLIVLATLPVLVSILYIVLRRHALTTWGWLAALVSVSGVLLTLGTFHPGISRDTIFLSLAAAFALAGYTVLAESLLERYSALKIAATSTLLGAVPIFALSLGSVVQNGWVEIGTPSWRWLTQGLYIALSYLVWNYAVRRVGGLRTTIYANLAGVVSGYLFFLTLSPLAGIAGITLLIISVFLLRRQIVGTQGAG